MRIDDELVRMLEQALEACPPGDSYERVRLLGRLAQSLYWSPEKERALHLSDEALAAARRLGDQASLAYALDSRNVVLWGPDNLDEGRTLAEEMLAIGLQLGDRDIQLEALLWLIPDALKRGKIPIVDRLIDEYARVGAELRQPYHLWFADVLRAMRAHLDGRFDEAVALSERAFAYGEQANDRNAFNLHTAQACFLWLDQGRAAELLDELGRSDADWGPSQTVPAVKALAFAGLDRREEALEQVGVVAERGWASVQRDALWEMSIVSFGRTVGHFDDPTHADELYELLLPFADRICVLGGAVLCLGPTSRILGMLARAGGRPDVALEHFGDALERSRRVSGKPRWRRAMASRPPTGRHLFKTFANVFFQKRSALATFMAKWSMAYPGQSGHCHFSFWRGDESLFFDAGAPQGISATQRHALGGLRRYLPEWLALIAPTINSYTRLVKGAWAPTSWSWGVENRTAAVRVIPGSAKAQRLECRAAGADANPYLAAAAIIGAALLGVEERLDPDEPITGNALVNRLVTSNIVHNR